MDIRKRIKELMDERNWTEYRLAKMANLSQSTVSNIFRRENSPTLPTIEAICSAFGITLSQFFSEDGRTVELTEEQRKHLDLWRRINPEQKEVIDRLLETIRK